jgi:integrase/recombinase XerD
MVPVVSAAANSPIPQSVGCPIDLRQARIEEFLQAKSLRPNSQRAYRQDLQAFLRWSSQPWEAVTPRQIVQFKADLVRVDRTPRLSDATIRRILGTLRTLYDWMQRVGYVTHNPTRAIELPKLPEPPMQHLSDQQVEQILIAAMESQLPERNLALLWVLQHNLRAGEASALDIADYDGQRLMIRQAKAGSFGVVPLSFEARSWLDSYLNWRTDQGEIHTPTTPLFVSYSHQNRGDRLGYSGIRKLMDTLSIAVGFKFHAHQFRHTYATNLMLKGMNPHHIMTLTRHKSPQNFRRYSRAAETLAAERAFYAAIGEAAMV